MYLTRVRCRRALLDHEVRVPFTGDPALQAQEGFILWHLIPSSLSCTTVSLGDPEWPGLQGCESNLVPEPKGQYSGWFFTFRFFFFFRFEFVLVLKHS